MKKVFNNNRLIAIAFFTVFSIATAPVAIANNSNPALPVELKFLGNNVNNQPVFQLNFFGNAEENDFTITIRDDYGNSLFSENIKGEVFSKKFLLNTEEIGDAAVRFEITGRKSQKTIVFEVNHQSHLQEEMVVRKLK